MIHSRSFWAVAPFFLGALGEGVDADAAIEELRVKMEISAACSVETGYVDFPDPYTPEGK